MITKTFDFFWKCAMAIGLYFVYREIYYIANILTSYVKMLLQAGSF